MAPGAVHDDDDDELSAYVLPVSSASTMTLPIGVPTVAASAPQLAQSTGEDAQGEEEAEEGDEDALVAEKIRLLQEENARLRAAAAKKTQGQQSVVKEEQADNNASEAAAAPAASLTAMADWLVAAAKERERSAAEAAAAEQEAKQQRQRRALLAQVDRWVEQSGGDEDESASARRQRDAGATPASVAALRVHIPKPQALKDGASAVLARLESQFGAAASPAGKPGNTSGGGVPGRATPLRDGGFKAAQSASLTAAVDDLERALARSAAVVAVQAAGGTGNAAGVVVAASARWRALPPVVRRVVVLLLFTLFFAAVFITDFYGSEEDQQEELLDRGVVFATQAREMEMKTLSALVQSGTDYAMKGAKNVVAAAEQQGSAMHIDGAAAAVASRAPLRLLFR